MEPNPAPESRSFLKGSAALFIAAGVVAGLLIEFPAYRWFFLISLGIGLVVAAVLYFWHKYVPVKEADVKDNQRPLGLD